MSLCIVLNNPNNFTIISSDGNLTNIKGEIVKDNHSKLTKLTDYIMIFISGLQNYCEELRIILNNKITNKTPLNIICDIIQNESIILHNKILSKYPNYLNMLDNKITTIATVLGFYNIFTNECGYINFCHSKNFNPIIITCSSINCRGIQQELAQEYIINNFNTDNIIDIIYSAYKIISIKENAVGGNISIYKIDKIGIKLIKEGDLN